MSPWDDIRDWWESDSFWRSQIVLAVIVGGIGFLWVLFELLLKRRLVGAVEPM